MKIVIAICVLFFTFSFVNAQDGVFLHKSICLSFKRLEYEGTPVKIEFYQSESHSDNNFDDKLNQVFIFDTLTRVYRFSYSKMIIGGGSSKNFLDCPQIFLKLSFLDSNLKPLIIPFSFDICHTSPISDINILNVDLTSIISNQNSWVVVIDHNKFYILQHHANDLDHELTAMKKLDFVSTHFD